MSFLSRANDIKSSKMLLSSRAAVETRQAKTKMPFLSRANDIKSSKMPLSSRAAVETRQAKTKILLLSRANDIKSSKMLLSSRAEPRQDKPKQKCPSYLEQTIKNQAKCSCHLERSRDKTSQNKNVLLISSKRFKIKQNALVKSSGAETRQAKTKMPFLSRANDIKSSKMLLSSRANDKKSSKMLLSSRANDKKSSKMLLSSRAEPRGDKPPSKNISPHPSLLSKPFCLMFLVCLLL
jgi:hypothetical protein